MICAVCDKESNNRRVCPFCFTPYPKDAPQSRPSTTAARQSTSTTRQSTATTRQSTGTTRQSISMATPSRPGDRVAGGAEGGTLGNTIAKARVFIMRQSPVARWSALGIVGVLLFWSVAGGDERQVRFEGGSVPSNIIASPMQREDAIALIKRTRETALVEEQSGEMMVSYPAATFPLLEQGQVALAQQFARADEIVEGRKRRIFFYNPSGRIFAQSDGVTGVTVIK